MKIPKDQEFIAIDKLGRRHLYIMKGLNLERGLIILKNIDLDEDTEVEFEWFKQRTIERIWR